MCGEVPASLVAGGGEVGEDLPETCAVLRLRPRDSLGAMMAGRRARSAWLLVVSTSGYSKMGNCRCHVYTKLLIAGYLGERPKSALSGKRYKQEFGTGLMRVITAESCDRHVQAIHTEHDRWRGLPRSPDVVPKS